MKRNIKITVLIIMALVVSLCSIVTSYSALVDGEDGVALVKEDVYQVDLVLNNSVTSNEKITFEGTPVIEDNELFFSIGLDSVGSFGQVYFDIYNSGDYDAILKDVEILGLGEFKDFVSVSLVGINIGDKIEKESLIKNVSVKINYDNDLGDIINLNNIGVRFNIEKV